MKYRHWLAALLMNLAVAQAGVIVTQSCNGVVGACWVSESHSITGNYLSASAHADVNAFNGPADGFISLSIEAISAGPVRPGRAWVVGSASGDGSYGGGSGSFQSTFVAADGTTTSVGDGGCCWGMFTGYANVWLDVLLGTPFQVTLYGSASARPPGSAGGGAQIQIRMYEVSGPEVDLQFTSDSTAIPEPASFLLAGAALILLFGLTARRADPRR